MIEQETMQMMLAYTVLLRLYGADGVSMEELGKTCEEQLWEMFQVDVEYNVEYGVNLLQSFNLLEIKASKQRTPPCCATCNT
eukprot:1301316-Pyramimonas_sp.AAC.1